MTAAVMSEFPFFYNRVSPTTWIHLSSLLTIAVFFKFSRLWSIRNLDLICLIAIAPGLLAVQYGHGIHDVSIEQAGYLWVFAGTLVFLIRMLIDPMMVRRPLLEPNLSAGGLTFLGIALFVFLMANVLTGNPAPDSRASQIAPAAAEPNLAADERAAREGPGYPPLFHMPNIITQDMTVLSAAAKAAENQPQAPRAPVDLLTSRVVLMLLHLAVVLGLVMIGYQHFDNVKTGIAAALLYLLLPYTAETTGYLRHVLAAAPLVFAILAYRRPLIAGAFIGLAIGLTYYPIFLLPLWLSFYWQRGLLRFVGGLIPSLGVLVGILAILVWPDRAAFIADLKQMFGWTIPQMAQDNFEGFWGLKLLDPVYRIPVLAACIALAGTMAIWPAQKNLGTLMSCSAAMMLANQFWNAHQGGLYVAWYLPLLLLTIFRPNLEDRVALSVLGDGWFSKRRPQLRIERAA
jgi:hypothetical protein